MQQEKIDFRYPELGETFLGGLFEIARGEMRRPHLGGDEHLVTLHAGGAQPLPDLALVAVHLRGVDVAIAEPQRLLDHAHAGLPAQVPGAETNQRNSRTIGFDNCPSIKRSQAGACGGLTTRASERLSLPISLISSGLRLKSNTARFAAR